MMEYHLSLEKIFVVLFFGNICTALCLLSMASD